MDLASRRRQRTTEIWVPVKAGTSRSCPGPEELSDLGCVCTGRPCGSLSPPPSSEVYISCSPWVPARRARLRSPCPGHLPPRKLSTGLPDGHAQQGAGPALWTEVIFKKGTFHPPKSFPLEDAPFLTGEAVSGEAGGAASQDWGVSRQPPEWPRLQSSWHV